MEIRPQRNDIFSVNIIFDLMDQNDVKELTVFRKLLTKLSKIVNKPGIRNDFTKEEKIVFNNFMNTLISERHENFEK